MQTDRRAAVLIALSVALAGFLVGTTVESAIIRAVHRNRADLEWISDVVVSAGMGVVTYLWLHLRSSRMRLLALERTQVALDEQLRLAAEIQRSLLPDLPRATPGFRWAARMVPAGQVGGDFYDFVPTAVGALVLVADVAGKGIPAALLLSSLKALFRTFAQQTHDPSEIAARLSQALLEEYGGLPYVTAIVACVENEPLRLCYVNAGHPAGYVLRDGSLLELASDAPPLGLLPGSRYETRSLDLAVGELGVFLTDGISEAFESGPASLAEALRGAERNLGDDRPPAALCDALLRAAAAGGGPVGVEDWQDDRTVLAFAVDQAP